MHVVDEYDVEVALMQREVAVAVEPPHLQNQRAVASMLVAVCQKYADFSVTTPTFGSLSRPATNMWSLSPEGLTSDLTVGSSAVLGP